jgi:dolichyl-phosphate-mannose-protein mannosyltransferase
MQRVATAVDERAESSAVIGQRDGRPYPPLRQRLAARIAYSPRLIGWLGPVSVAMLALVLRLWHLGQPHAVLFDETYYAKDAHSLLETGYVRDWDTSVDKPDTDVNELNERILDGDYQGLLTDQPTQVVHPEVGKWMIALGEWVFGFDPTGWRVSAAVVGALTVLVLARMVRRLSGSTLIGCVAGLLLTFDGLHLVMSRLALLDVFLAFWLVCAVACLVADRDWGRSRLARSLPDQPGRKTTAVEGFGPVRMLLWRPWRLAAGGCFGLACGTKWSAVYVLAAFGILVWVWDTGARRAIGVRAASLKSLVADGLPAFVTIVGVALVVYVLTWTGWLWHHEAYEQRFGFGYGDEPPWGGYLDDPASGWFGQTIQALRSLWHYHLMVYDFHVGDYLTSKTHPYQSHPQGWLLLNRPVGVAVTSDIQPGEQGCGAPEGSTCLRQVLALGNPAVWWPAAAALVVSLWQWIVRRDWRFAVPIVAVAATWLPWFRYDDRPIFSFYATAIIPFTCAALAMVLGMVLGPADGPRPRRISGAVLMVSVLVAVIVSFAYFWPIWTNGLITNEAWQSRMWLDSWI